jgi:hypothetical protein
MFRGGGVSKAQAKQRRLRPGDRPYKITQTKLTSGASRSSFARDKRQTATKEERRCEEKEQRAEEKHKKLSKESHRRAILRSPKYLRPRDFRSTPPVDEQRIELRLRRIARKCESDAHVRREPPSKTNMTQKLLGTRGSMKGVEVNVTCQKYQSRGDEKKFHETKEEGEGML